MIDLTGMNQPSAGQKKIAAIKEAFPDIDWDRFEDIDMSLNTELWHGTMPDNYWTEAQPLQHYRWAGFEQACKDIVDTLKDLPCEAWWDDDADILLLDDPENDEANWDEDDWIASITKVDPRQIVMYPETYKQVY